jgi:hypothetical protein
MKKKTLKEAIEESMYTGRVSLTADKLRIDSELLKGLFRDPLDHLVDHIKEIMNQPVRILDF